MTNKIPKIIHQIWIQGHDKIPDKLKIFQQQILKLHNNDKWKYILWDDNKIIELISKVNKVLLDTYLSFTYLHQKVDLAKLIILYVFGGIVIDMDAYTIKKLDTLFDKYNNYDFIISYFRNIGYIGNYVICGQTSQCFNNGNFISKQHANILLYMINHIVNNSKCSVFDFKENCINKSTGPLFFNSVINRYISDNNITNKSSINILDYKILEPCDGNNNCDIIKDTYIIHKHEHSWHNGFMKIITIMYLSYRQYLYFVCCILVVMIIYYMVK
jgi:mannosyltransferase OCH1-like enzyme